MHSKGEDLIDVVNELNERLEHLEKRTRAIRVCS